MNSLGGYKETGIDWISEIPFDWNVSRSKFIFKNKSLKNFPNEPLLSVTQLDGVVLRSESNMNVWNPTDDVSGYKLIEPGDFVISLRSFEGGLELSEVRGLVSPAYTVLQTIKRIDVYYFRWLMKSYQFIIELNKHVTGIRQGKNIGWDDFSNIYITIPLVEEQKLISRYLDKKTEQIDRLVEKIQKKIELLKEQRTSLINQCVIKGLDPNVEMKDSGVEWIGEIPKHWNLVRNKNFLTQSKNIVGENWKNHILLSLGKLGVIVRDVESGKGKFPESFEAYQEVKRGQFVFCLFDMDETPRTVGLSNEVGMITGAYTVFDCSDLVSSNFIYYYYLAIDEFKGLAPHYSGLRKTIRPTKFLSLNIHLPSLDEQNKIVEFIKEKSHRIDNWVSIEQKRIGVLKEYRQSLISSVVTGKVRVTEEMI